MSFKEIEAICLLFVMHAYCGCTFVSIRLVSDLSKCVHEASILAVMGVAIVNCYTTQHQFKVVWYQWQQIGLKKHKNDDVFFQMSKKETRDFIRMILEASTNYKHMTDKLACLIFLSGLLSFTFLSEAHLMLWNTHIKKNQNLLIIS